MKVVRYIPKIKDFYELIKLIPDKWKYRDSQYTNRSGKWIIAEVNTLTCKDFYNTIHFRTLMPMYENRKYLQWQINDPNKFSEKQWNTVFKSL